jgi:hypothetical protein
MTRTEVDQIITDTLHKTLGHHAHLFNLQESTQQKQAREAAEDKRKKEEKSQRRESKQLRESSREMFERSGMTREQAKKAAKAVTSPAYQARYHG